MVDIKASPTGGAVFKYNQAPNDHRCSYDTIDTNASIEDLRGMHDGTPTDKFATLAVYPSTDFREVIVDTPVDTEVEWDDICLAYQTPKDADIGICRVVYYDKSFKRKLVFIEEDSLLTLWAKQGILP
jgi:hypothetical protein